MITVNSLSGGKTSSYLAVHYPADLEIFALVCNDDPECAHPDPKVMQYANDKLEANHFGEFIGTPEHYYTLDIIMNLEQKIGREINWVRGESFDKLIAKKKALPNQNTRWCTTLMKLEPIFWYCYLNYEFVNMRVGYRFDEFERKDTFSTAYKFPYKCSLTSQKRQSWKETEWRTGEFPLIDNMIDHYKIWKYWQSQQGFVFPPDSNCQNCFWKDAMQLRKNFDDSPNVMQWAKRMEKRTGNRFKHGIRMDQIEQIGLQQDFFYGGGSGCQAGFCTD